MSHPIAHSLRFHVVDQPIVSLILPGLRSAHRLRHLFSDKLGISIKSYTLWARMRRAVELIAHGESLSVVAHDVGFSDAAHLTRTLKQFFGLTPSFVARGMGVRML